MDRFVGAGLACSLSRETVADILEGEESESIGYQAGASFTDLVFVSERALRSFSSGILGSGGVLVPATAA